MRAFVVLLIAGASMGCSKKEPSRVTEGAPSATVAHVVEAAAPASSVAVPAARPLYFAREITMADLEGRTLRELTLMRNTIFARAGNPFRKPWLDEYFSAQAWYHPLEKMDEARITPLDRKNARIVADYEAELTGADLAARLAKVEARFDAGVQSAEDDVELRLLSSRLGKWVGGAAGKAGSPLEDPMRLNGLLTLKDLAKLSRRDLRLLRNVIYARRGRPFKSEILKEYFSAMEWYEPDPTYTDARLTPTDNKNIRLIQSVEDSLGGPISDSDHNKEDWMGGA